MTSPARLAWWVVGGVLIVAGVLLAILAGAEPVTRFSFLSYEQVLDDQQITIDYDGGWFVSPWQVVGASLAVLGVLVLVGRAAYLRGRRPSRA